MFAIKNHQKLRSANPGQKWEAGRWMCCELISANERKSLCWSLEKCRPSAFFQLSIHYVLFGNVFLIQINKQIVSDRAHSMPTHLGPSSTFTSQLRAFSRHFCPKQLTVIHTYIQWWQWLPFKVLTSTSGADVGFSILPKETWTSTTCDLLIIRPRLNPLSYYYTESTLLIWLL